MNASIRVVSTGLVYRNPSPHLRSVVAYHPSLVPGNQGDWFATFDIGQSVEAFDYHTVSGRSRDGGESWYIEGPLLKEAPQATTHTIRTSRLRDQALIGFGGLFHRKDPEQGLINRETFGFTPMDLFLVRSFDDGRSWTSPEKITPPLEGPAWEICHPIVELKNGRWLAPTATWRGWKGENPSGEQTVALISDDRGLTWPTYGCIFDGRPAALRHLEVSVVELDDATILAVAWAYDISTGKTLPTVSCFSENHGETFGKPEQTDIEAQTCKLLRLADGRILCVYRRNDKPGLWAALVDLRSRRWRTLAEEPLWLGADSGMKGRSSSADELSTLRFGYPSLQGMPGGNVLCLFWCQEDCITNIRWLRISVE